jgi:hypothetical protein
MYLFHRFPRAVAIASILVQLVLTGCSGGDHETTPPPGGPPPPVATLPTLGIGDVAISEGQNGTVLATFTVTLSAASGQIVTADYATQDSTATAGSDYVATSGTITFAANVLTATIVVSVQGDTAVEPDELFFVNIDHPTNATVATARGTGTISNEDVAAALSMSATSNSFLTHDSQAIEVQLGAPAGANGVHVTLSSSNTALATVTASVDIPTGATAGYVELTAGAAAGNATLTASAATDTAHLDVSVDARELALAGNASGSSPNSTRDRSR